MPCRHSGDGFNGDPASLARDNINNIQVLGVHVAKFSMSLSNHDDAIHEIFIVRLMNALSVYCIYIPLSA